MSQKIKQIQSDLRMTKSKPDKRIYPCSYCGYTSLRLFNVQRHERRIHSKRKNPKICCGEELLTKSQYYIHCEKHHPETRANAITSRQKYKISKYSVALNDKVKELNQVTLKRRFSARLLAKKERRKTQVSLSYKVTYSDTDRVSMEDMPLKYFLTDHRLRRHMKRQSSLSKMNKTNENPEKNNEEIAFENGTQEHLDSFDFPTKNLIDFPAKNLIDFPAKNLIDFPAKNLIDFPPKNLIDFPPKKLNDFPAKNLIDFTANNLIDFPANNLIDLPAKKLILHRFRRSTIRTFGIPLRDENNNVIGHTNTSEAMTTATESVSLMQNYEYRSKNLKWGANKENLPTFEFSFQEKVDIVLDSCIAAPVVTQLQRDFLDSIDFDQYRIF